jgi:hypothetical protein
MTESPDTSASSKASDGGPEQSRAQRKKLFDRISDLLGRWTKLFYAAAGLAVAISAFWTVVWPHLPHHHSLKISATCSLSNKTITRGELVRLTYTIDSSSAVSVGLGAGIYNNQSIDESTGYGDVDSYSLRAGSNTYTRPVPIPSNLKPGLYEIDGEIWPANEVGGPGANTYAGPTCAWFKVP